MHIRKTLISALALAIAVAFSPLPELQAATLVGPGSQPGTDNLIQTAKMKKKGKKAGSKAGKCGTYMYFSKKTKKCMDARKK